MQVDLTAWGWSLLGGILVGLSSAVLMLGAGRVAGISGIFAGALGLLGSEAAWRLAFVAGLVTGGVTLFLSYPEVFAGSLGRPLPVVAVAGLCVGFGVRLAGGCTSGHGVCGIGRGSVRSVVATLTFIAAGAVSTYVATHVLGW